MKHTTRKNKVRIFEDLKQSLHEALAYEQGRKSVLRVTEVRNMLDSRYDDIRSGRVRPMDGEAFFESLREREDELLKKHTPK